MPDLEVGVSMMVFEAIISRATHVHIDPTALIAEVMELCFDVNADLYVLPSFLPPLSIH